MKKLFKYKHPKKKRKYIINIANGPRNHFYDPENAAEWLCATAAVDSQYIFDGLVLALKHMKIGETKAMELVHIKCVEV